MRGDKMYKVPIKQLLCAAAVAGTCATASAATTDLATLEVGATPFNGAVLGGPPPITFGDVFTFELPANGGSDYSVLNFPVPQFNADLTFASLALFSMGADGAFGGTGGNADILRASANGVVNTGSDLLSVSLGATQSSDKMYLLVSGLTTGSAGGLYSGAISVTPVPEPEVWAMMLVGAGLVGFRLRNRSKKLAANRFV
jgi:hypothetical protein